MTFTQLRTLRGLTLDQRAALGPDQVVLMPGGQPHTLGNLVIERADTGEYTKIRAYSKTTDVWLDLLSLPVVVDPPPIREFLELSTAHLPRYWGTRDLPHAGLDHAPGVVAYSMAHGWLMWVPDDPAGSATALDELEGVPAEVLTVQLYARALDCDWVMFDADGPTTTDLPTLGLVTSWPPSPTPSGTCRSGCNST